MKKYFFVLIAAVGIMTATRAQEKTVTGLTTDELAVLKEKNPDFNIDLRKWDPRSSPYFTGLDQAQAYVDSLREVILKMTKSEQQGVSVQGSKEGKFAPCDCGTYSANVGGAGMFSSFNLTFSVCNGTISNANLSVNGWQIGWTWSPGSPFLNGLQGCVSGAANFGLGIFTWSQSVFVRFSFNPNSCTLYYTLERGGCTMFSN